MRDQVEIKSTCDKACEILSMTNDGDKLSPRDLKVLEMAVNGHLNEAGTAAFDEIYANVTAGTYVRPWLHDIEGFTVDHEGFIYYNGTQFEHFSRDYTYTEKAKAVLTEYARRIEILKEKGLEVSAFNFLWHWEDISGNYKIPDYLRLPLQNMEAIHKVVGDISYCANVIAFETGLGTGSSEFLSLQDAKAVTVTDEQIAKVAKRLSGCYNGLTPEMVEKTVRESLVMIAA